MAGFRLKALAKARVADPTTKKMSISPLRGWLAFVGACLIVAGSLLWAVYSTLAVSITSDRSFFSPDDSGRQQVYALVSIEEAQQLRTGMEATVSLSGFPSSRFGRLRGRVESIDSVPVGRERLVQLLGAEELVPDVTRGAPGYLVEIRLLDGTGPEGFERTHGGAPENLRLLRGAPAQVQIVLDLFHPYEVLFDYES